MSKVSIIGANGYIARNLYYHLSGLKEADEIYLYDCFDESADKNVNYTKVDILNREDLCKVNFDCDYIFFMAGKTGTAAGFDNYRTFIGVNEIGLLNFIDEYRKQSSKAKIVFPSTRLIYRGSDQLLPENAEKEFKTVYSINKFACENYLKQYSAMFGIRYCIFRICVPYGTRIDGASSYGTAEFMVKQAKTNREITLYGDGSIRRTWTHIDDICRALICGAFSEACTNDVFNIGGDNLSLKEVAEMICSEYNASVKFVPWPEQSLAIESGSTVFDDSKFVSTTGFKYIRHLKKWERNDL